MSNENNTPVPNVSGIPDHVRKFLGKVQGVCMGVAMSGKDHPNPDGALMELFNEAQDILYPDSTTVTKPVKNPRLQIIPDTVGTIGDEFTHGGKTYRLVGEPSSDSEVALCLDLSTTATEGK